MKILRIVIAILFVSICRLEASQIPLPIEGRTKENEEKILRLDIAYGPWGSCYFSKLRVKKDEALKIFIEGLKDESIYIRHRTIACLNSLMHLGFKETEEAVKEAMERAKRGIEAKEVYTWNGSPWDANKRIINIGRNVLSKISYYKINNDKERIKFLEEVINDKKDSYPGIDMDFVSYELGEIGLRVDKKERAKIISILENIKCERVRDDGKLIETWSEVTKLSLVKLKAVEEGKNGLIRLLKLEGVKVYEGVDEKYINKDLQIFALNKIKELKIVDALPVIKEMLKEKMEKANERSKARIEYLKKSMVEIKEKVDREKHFDSEYREREKKNIEKIYKEDIEKAPREELMKVDGEFVTLAEEVVQFLESLPKEEKK
jgi:hypothetical protein